MDIFATTNQTNEIPNMPQSKWEKKTIKSKKDALCNQISFPEKTVHKNTWNIFSIYPKV